MLFAGHITLSNGSWVPNGTVVLSRNLTLATGAFPVWPYLLLLMSRQGATKLNTLLHSVLDDR